MAKPTQPHPFQTMEEDAYHAFREWALWLVLRERELAAHLSAPSIRTDRNRPESANPSRLHAK